jgi:Flp pilus assembly protein TadB
LIVSSRRLEDLYENEKEKYRNTTTFYSSDDGSFDLFIPLSMELKERRYKMKKFFVKVLLAWIQEIKSPIVWVVCWVIAILLVALLIMVCLVLSPLIVVIIIVIAIVFLKDYRLEMKKIAEGGLPWE